MKRLKIVKRLAGLAVVAAVFSMTAFSVLAAEGKVTATAVIRADTSTDSEAVGSATKGKTIDILEAVKDSSGTVWYKVPISGGGYGYIRSDLVQTSETIEISSNASSSQTNNKPADTVPTSIGEQQATIKSSDNANIRSGASTQHAVVASVPNGTPVTLIGEATDGSGNKWYQLTCSYNNKSIEGYVRWDLIEVGAGESSEGGGAEGTGTEGAEGENPESAEGENPEGTGDAPAEGTQASADGHNDYEVVYTNQNETGEYDYYLFMNADGTMVKVSELLSASTYANESIQKIQGQLDKEKIIIFILAGVIVLLFIVITILLLKIRGLYYEDYDEDDEEEEEEEEEPEPVRKKVKKRAVEEEPVPIKKRKPTGTNDYERAAKIQDRQGQSKVKGEKELYAAERKEPAKKPSSRKPQNFLIDDDEFEFEFLNMDDKDI